MALPSQAVYFTIKGIQEAKIADGTFWFMVIQPLIFPSPGMAAYCGPLLYASAQAIRHTTRPLTFKAGPCSHPDHSAQRLYERILPYLCKKPLSSIYVDNFGAATLPGMGALGWRSKLRGKDPTHAQCLLEVRFCLTSCPGQLPSANMPTANCRLPSGSGTLPLWQSTHCTITSIASPFAVHPCSLSLRRCSWLE